MTDVSPTSDVRVFSLQVSHLLRTGGQAPDSGSATLGWTCRRSDEEVSTDEEARWELALLQVI